MHPKVPRRLLAALCATAMAAALAACGDNVDPNETPTRDASSIAGSFAGAGASSQQSAVEAWIAGFQKKNPDAKISYNPSGSGAGVTTFLTGATVWAGSDRPLSDDQVKESTQVCAGKEAFDVPVYISPLAVVYHVEGLEGDTHIRMDVSVLARIFDGKITNWNDRAIAALNPDLKLPDLPITVVHRSDKSGTTLNFVEYLKAAAPKEWKYATEENWPNDVGQGAKGTSGVISTIDQANGTIGYADFSQVGDLGTVDIKVGDSYTRISAEAASLAVADSTLEEESAGSNRVVLDINHTTTTEGAYPIVLVSYDIACPVYADADTARFAKAFLGYVVSDDGQEQAMRATGSAPLPDNIASLVQASVSKIAPEGE
ncbi:phosphate ABC transporter substrate-binding protein PstS [Bifidobacterium cuniculi]|uniref:Phosphate-binding protein n=1 Tax=Bifidobacterium cuniculi TaxID=1688 RepID=A0A087AY86_9BIFI|nr:phosphate ABC transporter substrate-binding protein PstS [Bifidobacterium cuniculi]KFI63736.1 phosphate-binding transport protein of ABC transporter system [Bifidobacterium cuniculi]